MFERPLRRCWPALAILFTASCHDLDLLDTAPAADQNLVDVAAFKLEEAPLAAAAAKVVLGIWPLALSCPETFDLDGAVHGTCTEVDPGGGYYYGGAGAGSWTLYATASLPGGSSTLELPVPLRVAPGAEHEYALDVWDSTANVTNGDGGWRLSGNASTDASGNPGEATLRLTTSRAAWPVRSGRIDFTLAGAAPATVLIDLSSGAGTIGVGGGVVANVQVAGGCVTIDFVDPATPDRNTCMW